MKLATLRDGTRDGALVVVRRDGTTFARAHDVARTLQQRSLGIYKGAAEFARNRGILIADTKFEWGKLPNGELILIDEVLTPDSSRFWPLDGYRPGGSPPSFDKQFVRDWLETTGWDKNSDPPALPADVVTATRAKYLEALQRIANVSL